MVWNRIYITLMLLVFLAFTMVFIFFPRPTYSHLENRELTTFPSLSLDSILDGSFTESVSSWFSDSEPFRDELMSVSMHYKDLIRYNTGEENITFHASTNSSLSVSESDSLVAIENTITEYENNITATEDARIANAGILIVGNGSSVRALMAFGGSANGNTAYADAANLYQETFGDLVRVYCMVIPTSIEFYCPDKAKHSTNPQRPFINNIHAHLNPNIAVIDVYTTLAEHVNEDIFLRTDHHWSPLGAYYAAKEFARVAGVPFNDLDSYKSRTIHKFVGTMYAYSQDISIKEAPEDFTYYMPLNVEYTTTYTDYVLDANYRIIAEKKPFQGKFFQYYCDGNGGAYCTFMGSDKRITVVRTSTKNGRRLIILKDSFGNALPGYLFYSFEEIHVIDSRYFKKNMKAYVYENLITDILFANNIFNAYSPRFCRKYITFLSQSGKIAQPPLRPAPTAIPSDTIVLPLRSDSVSLTKEDSAVYTTPLP